MIYRLQKRFIIICSISVFLVTATMFAVISALNVSSVNRNLDMLADGIFFGNGVFPENFGSNGLKKEDTDNPELQPKPDIRDDDRNSKFDFDISSDKFGFINEETRFSTRYFAVWLNADGTVEDINTEHIYSISDESALRYAEKVLNGNFKKGWDDGFRYKVFDTDEGYAVVFIDGSSNRSAMLQSVLSTGAVLLVCSVLVVLLVIFFSKRAMKPIAESYEKQRQFVTDANHELKTPLTLILADLDIAESELGSSEWFDDMRSEGQRMAELVNQLVSLSRMDEGDNALNETQIALSELASDTVSEFSTLASERGKTLYEDIEENVFCCGDEMPIRRLVAVLLDNAVKYCDEGGEIKVALKKGRSVTLTVENSYRDVESLELNRLFDRFYRADKARTYTGGFGIGLSIAKAIAQKHGGDIIAYKKDGDHIGFKVTLKNRF